MTHTTVRAAVDAAIARHSNRRLFIAIMPGEYPGTVYVPAAPGALTLYGTGDKPIDVKISEAIDSEMDRNTGVVWSIRVANTCRANQRGICSTAARANPPPPSA